MPAESGRPENRGGERWRSRRVAAWLLRAGIFLAPFAAAVAASLWLSSRLYEPASALEVVGWWAILIGFSSVVAWAVERLARRLLPLTVMLRMTMLFPDRAPPRYRVALRASNVTELKRRVAEAEENGKTDLSAAAELTLTLASALNDHDRRTRGHGERTRAYTDMLAEELNIDDVGRDKLRWAALLHDIGKLEVPAEILNKDGPLEPEEMEVIKRHPVMGMKVASALVPWLGEWAGAIEHHHEWWDGSGYPRGLKGEEISLGARIVSVADAYDVMTSGRSYQAAMSASEARQETARMAGTQFDPTVVRALMSVALGRLRWVVGPVAWLGQVPFFLDRIGRDLVTVSTAATMTVAAAVAGVVPLPILSAPADAITAEVVSAEPSLSSDPSTTGSEAAEPDTGRFPASSPADTTPSTSSPSTTSSSTTTTIAPTTTPPTTPPPPTSTPPTTTPPTTSPPTTTPPTTSPPTTTPPTTLPPPTANPDVASTDEDRATVVDVTANDTPSGMTLDAITSNPASGQATITGAGSIRYAPAPNDHGTVTFGYRACAPSGLCDQSTVAVVVNPVNDPPVARPDTAVTHRGEAVSVDVLSNDSDVDGDTLVVRSVGSPGNGTAVTDGTFVTYMPAPDFVGDDSFTYRACDPGGLCATTTVAVTVQSGNRPPNAMNDSAATNPAGRVNIAVLANDSDPDGDLDPESLTIVTPPAHGEAIIGGGRVRYRADTGFQGTDTFVYRVCDLTGLCDSAKVTVLVD